MSDDTTTTRDHFVDNGIPTVDINDEIATAFLDYAMSVIVSRALPDVRDGLKPVQRRIVYSMFEEGMHFTSRHRKCANVVGNVMGRYHPHSNDAIYDALVRLGQDFNTRYQLIDPQGNFGTVDDPPAAMRYCVVGETRVRTADGSTPRIDSLVPGAEPNSDTDIDIKLLDRHGNPVRASAFFHSGSHEILALHTKEGFSISGTHNHPVLCLTPVAGVPMFQWRLLSELQAGDRVAVDRSSIESLGGGETHESDVAFLLGALGAEGFVSQDRAGFNTTDQAFFEEVVTAFDRTVGGPRYTTERLLPSGRTLHELDVHDMTAIRAAEVGFEVGLESADKRVPEVVWAGSPAAKRAFLQSAFERDGSCSALPGGAVQVSYSTRSERLAQDLQLLLLEFGAVFRRVTHRCGEVKLVVSNSRDAEVFGSRVGFWGAKQAKLQDLLGALPPRTGGPSGDDIPFIGEYIRSIAPRGDREFLANADRVERRDDGAGILAGVRDPEALSVVAPIVEAGYFYATVDRVEPAGVAPVYSVRVDSEDHAFLANGLVNHNTECRLSGLSKFLTEGINEDTVEYEPNYDGEYQQPSVLPSRFPNLLVNGSTGIAVGMATNMPPHNLNEVIAAVTFALDNPDAPAEAYLDFVKGPDFPTGGLIVGRRGIQDALLTGRGSVKVRAVTEMEELPRGRTAIVVRELPYMVSQDRVLEKIAGLVNDKKLTGISDLRNESSERAGTRLVIELKRDAVPQVVLNQLFKMTQLQDTFGVNNVALVDGVPRTLNLAEMIGYYVDHQMEVIERRTRFRLQKAKDRAHIVEGLLIALDNIDEVVQIIRGSQDVENARERLMDRFGLSEVQSQHILNMPLRRLTALETDELRAEYRDLMDLITELEGILLDPARRRAIIAEELEEIRQKYGDDRRSLIIPDDGDMTLEDLIADDDLIITVSTNGYIKSVKSNVYRSQGRGGRGVIAAELREDDIVDAMIHTSSHQNLLFFTNKGLVHRIKAHQIPVQTRTGKGVVAQAVLPLEPDEHIQAVIDTKDFSEAEYLTVITKLGVAKKTEFAEYDSRQASIIAIRLQEDDEVVAVRATSGENEVLLFTSDGMGIRFAESDLRPMGRATQGVRGIRLREGDTVVAAASSNDGEEILLLSSGGYGKRTALEHFRAQKRGGIGVKAMKLTRVRGTLIGARAVSPDDEIFVINTSGVGIRTAVKQISRQKREATGVRVMNLEGDDRIAAFAIVPTDDAVA